MIDVGLVGYGFAGQVFHAPVIQATSGIRLAAVVRRSGEPDTHYPEVQFVRSLDELLAIDSIRLVVVATTNTSHYEIARQCLQAGRDVVVDKPFTTTLAEAQGLVQFAEKQKRMLTVYQNRRWDSGFKTVQQIIREGRLGRVVQFESNFDRFRPELRAGAWREKAEPGAGVFFDLGPHLIDQALALFGTPEAITGDVRIEREGAVVDDAFSVVLHYSRMRAVLRASMLAVSPAPTYYIRGTSGTFVKYGVDPQEESLKQGGSPADQGWGTEPPAQWGKIVNPGGEQPVPTLAGDYRGFYENVRDTLLGVTDSAVTTQQALDVMKALELVLESSRKRSTLKW